MFGMISPEFKGICLTVLAIYISDFKLSYSPSCNPVEEGHALFSIGLLNTGTVNSY